MALDNLINIPMYISTSKKFVFFRIPRTGSTAMTTALMPFIKPNRAIFGREHWFRMPEVNLPDELKRWPYFDHQHATQKFARYFIDYAGLRINNYYEFVFVRNPYDRLVSLWTYTNTTSPPHLNLACGLDAFLDELLEGKTRRSTNNLYDPQVTWTKEPLTNNLHIFKYEEIDRAWAELVRVLDLGDLELPVINNSRYEGEYNITLSQEQRDKIYQLYREDFEAFGYER